MTKASSEKYNPRELEPKWIKAWEEAGIYKAEDFSARPKKYLLFEFPYPSGERLHVGHARSYTALDAMARKARMQGFNVLLPLGWDAFGLPAENYAIRTGINPRITTEQNIHNAKIQAKRWGLSVDWEREINTTDPKYYKWTQWIFLQLYNAGLAYRAEVPVNWCPACRSILAEEEVLADRTHERCGKPTERKMQKQWILRITKYADRLIDGLKEVDYSPRIALQQVNWIGRSEGATIKFSIFNLPAGRQDFQSSIEVFTTRPDTIFGATALVVAPEYPLLEKLITPGQRKMVEEYVAESKKKSEMERTELAKEKTGVFTGSFAINPANGKKIPIWVGDYVVGWYGHGAIMVVPAHDERDWKFAKKYGLPIIPVIAGGDVEKGAFVGEGKMINSNDFNGLESREAVGKITEWLGKKGVAEKEVTYKLRDWIFSRQHYWGEPIPIIHCEKCGVVPVPEEDLPVELPYVERYQPCETGESPLAGVLDWVNITCPLCGGKAKRETDTMPNWAGSNWYFVRYLDPQNDEKLVELDKAKYWLPVDLYNGGMEHTTLHLLYSRFIYKFLYDIGAVPGNEPYAKRRSHGVVLGPDGQKMSKSRGNVVNPDEVVEGFGADAFRLYESFMGPFDQMTTWSQEALGGTSRFLKRVWTLAQSTEHKAQRKTDSKLLRKLHQTIKKVGEDIEEMKFNTAVAAMMEFINDWQAGVMAKEDVAKFLQILAPFAPFLTEELWLRLGFSFSIHTSAWPEYNPSSILEETVTIVVQVNGKRRDQIIVQSLKSKVQSEVEELAKKSEKAQKQLKGKEIRNVVFVPGKLINFVV